MTYRLYIYIITQLATRKFVVLSFGSHDFYFKIDEERGEWNISLRLSSLSKERCSEQIKECFSVRNTASFFQKGSQVVIDNLYGPGVYLVRDTKPMEKYLLFKELFEEIVSEADDFKELFSLT